MANYAAQEEPLLDSDAGGGHLLGPSNMDIETARGPLDHDPLDMAYDDSGGPPPQERQRTFVQNSAQRPIVVQNGSSIEQS